MFPPVRRLREALTAPSWAAIRLGVVAGVVHAAAVLWVGAFVRQQSVWTRYYPAQPSAALVTAYVVFGLVVLGGVAAVLLVHGRLVTPAAALLVVFSWATYRSWQSFEAAREAGVTPGVTLRPDAAYLFFWFVPLALALLVGALEYALRTGLGGWFDGRRLE
ncbi:hypothetical protein [Natrononativus amylolyticus]|uniref:hypothetical protein n=1 Tax=Natrononativus amylolyticus TaxID=2963434 RepID=UPI0020CBBCCC|nr:hypothetical protein [Natrononativus amylolyticus]